MIFLLYEYSGHMFVSVVFRFCRPERQLSRPAFRCSPSSTRRDRTRRQRWGNFLCSDVPWLPVVPPATCCTSSGDNSRAPLRVSTRFDMICSNMVCVNMVSAISFMEKQIATRLTQLKKNRSRVQCFTCNFLQLRSQKGREMMHEAGNPRALFLLEQIDLGKHL